LVVKHHAIFPSMPQLDTITYMSQLFWTFITFAGFHVIACGIILPNIFRVSSLAFIGNSLTLGLFDSVNAEVQSSSSAASNFNSGCLESSRILLGLESRGDDTCKNLLSDVFSKARVGTAQNVLI
jgi:hypothetical protein